MKSCALVNRSGAVQKNKNPGAIHIIKGLFFTAWGILAVFRPGQAVAIGNCIKSSPEQSGFMSILLLDHISIKVSEMKAAGKTETAPGRAQHS